MKLQGLSVFFCLIAVPIILVLTAYVQAQITTISMQLAYDTKLLDATHDAMVALEINTANEELSSVSDSLRSIVNASANTFINSLSTNMGMSSATKSALQPYIPAIVVTLYDGYYIYSPTRTPIICTNDSGVAVYVGDVGVVDASEEFGGYKSYRYDSSVTTALDTGVTTDYGMLLYKVKDKDCYITGLDEDIIEYTTDYVLKAYIPYAARYKNDAENLDIQINYTLDNFMNIYGVINDVYYTKSGYYTNVQVDSVKLNDVEVSSFKGYTEITVDDFVDSHINDKMSITLTVPGETNSFVITSSAKAEGDEDYGIIDEEKEAIKYYWKSYVFSNWLTNNLGNLKVSDIEERISEENLKAYGSSIIGGNDNDVVNNVSVVTFSGNNNLIFNSLQNPEVDDSTFSLHKRDVMKNSIQYNLNVAMSSYNEMNLSAFSFNMPVIDDETWDKMTSQVSIVAFMQGFKCGLKTYNNYACVSSTNNEFTVLPEEIYYVGPESTATPLPGESGLNDMNTKYHRLDCPEFSSVGSTKGILETICSDSDVNITTILEDNVSSFVSKEIKYDKVYDKLDETYSYNHQNLACYQCIVSRNYKTIRKDGTDEKEGYYNSLDFSSLSMQAKKVYLIAIGKEREELYKTNQITLTQGINVFDTSGLGLKSENPHTIQLSSYITTTDYKIKDVESIEITFTDVGYNDSELGRIIYIEPTVNSRRIYNTSEDDGLFRLITQDSAQTITLKLENALDDLSILESEETIGNVVLTFYSNSIDKTIATDFKYWVQSIKINYK